MIEVNALLFTLLAEGTGLLSIILIIWIVLSIRKKAKDKAAAKTLIAQIKKQSVERLNAIKTFLSTTGLEGDELQIEVKKIDRLEKDFFTQLVRLYLKREAAILSSIDKPFDLVIASYKEKVSEQSNTDAVEEDQNLVVIKVLEKEKEALNLELEITKTTMGNMMTEFNTMFAGGNETVQTSKEALQSTMAEVESDDVDVEEEIDVHVEDSVAEENVDDVSESDIDDIFNTQEAAVPAARIEEPSKAVDEDEMDDIFSAVNVDETMAPKPLSESDEDFGSIVSSDDVDDLLDGIDLSQEIDMK